MCALWDIFVRVLREREGERERERERERGPQHSFALLKTDQLNIVGTYK